MYVKPKLFHHFGIGKSYNPCHVFIAVCVLVDSLLLFVLVIMVMEIETDGEVNFRVVIRTRGEGTFSNRNTFFCGSSPFQ